MNICRVFECPHFKIKQSYRCSKFSSADQCSLYELTDATHNKYFLTVKDEKVDERIENLIRKTYSEYQTEIDSYGNLLL